MSFEQTLISVWRQALVDRAEQIKLNGRVFPVRRTPKKHLSSGFPSRRRDSARSRTESGNVLPLGAAGETRSQDHAVSFRRPLRRQRRGR